MLELRVDEFLDQLARGGRTPGAGSLAAIVTAASAALIAKVARTSSAEWKDARSVAAQAEALRDRVAPLAQIDADEYEEAMRLLEEPAGEGASRDAALGRAVSRAAVPPLQIAETAVDVALLGVVVCEHGDVSLRTDAASACALAAAAARASAELVAINLTAQPGDPRVEQARRLADDAARAADQAFAVGGQFQGARSEA